MGSTVYVCGQLTDTVHAKVMELLTRGDEELVLAAPTFNLHSYDESTQPSFAAAFKRKERAVYNIPVYGPVTTEAVVELITRLNNMDTLSSILGSAGFTRNTFVINKAWDSVTKNIVKNEELEALVKGDEAKERLRKTKENLKKLLDDAWHFQPKSVPDWYQFVTTHLDTDTWKSESALHVQSVLTLFGLEPDEAKACAGRRFKLDANGKEDPTQRGEVWRALEWLTKMLSGGFGPAGATSDVVNLIYALEGAEPEEPVAQVIHRFIERRLNCGDDGLRDLDLPRVMVNDGEFDDTLAWKLLHHLHERKGTLKSFKVYVQMADFTALSTQMKKWTDRLATFAWLERLSAALSSQAVGAIIVTDPKSKNAQKVAQNPMWRLEVEEEEQRQQQQQQPPAFWLGCLEKRASGTVVAKDGARTLDVSGVHAAFVSPTSGRIASWGAMRGVVAKDEDAAKAWADAVKEMDGGGVVLFLGASKCHAVAVTADGFAYSWGSNEYGQLGHSKGEDVEEEEEEHQDDEAEEEDEGNGNGAEATGGGSDAASRRAPLARRRRRLPSFCVPRRIQLTGIRFARVACGSTHTLLLSQTGHLFSCGGDEFGQLGHGERKSEARPRQVAALDGEAVREISAGAAHSLAVTADKGDLYSWGCSHYGRLGHVTAARQHDSLAGIQTSHAYEGKPKKVDVGGASVVHVAAGTFHSVAVIKGGEAFSFGCGEGGRLGHGADDVTDQWTPKRIEVVVAGDVKAVEGVEACAAGLDHSVLLQKDGELLTFGRNACGELGHGDRTPLSTPKAVDFFSSRKATDPWTDPIVEIAAGDHHTVVRTASGRLYRMGLGAPSTTSAQVAAMVSASNGGPAGKRRDHSQDALTPTELVDQPVSVS